jgi:hypothetical protein
MLRRKQKRQQRRDLRNITEAVLEDYKDDPDQRQPTRKEFREEVLRRYELRQHFNLDPEVKSMLREFFLKLLDLFINRLFSQWGM